MSQINSSNFTRQRKAEPCPKCNTIVSLSNMTRHVASCGTIRYWVSPQRKQNGLPPTSELVSHIPESDCGKWHCDKCTKVFKTKKSLAHHYWQIHPSLENETKKSISNQFISGRLQCHSVATRKKLSQKSRANPAGVAIDPSLRSYAGRSKHYSVVDSFGNNVILQSSWEYLLMIDLNANGILWRRPDPFWLKIKSKNGRPSSYTPDFWLPEYDLYIDPKSREHDEQSIRIDYWLNQYNKKLLIIRTKSQLTWSFVKSTL